MLKLTNNAVSRLVSSLAASATTIPIQTGEGSRFPVLAAGDWFPVTILRETGVLEIMKCTERSGDNLTVVRAQEGTTAKTFSAGDRVELRMTAGTFNTLSTELQQQIIDFIAGYPLPITIEYVREQMLEDIYAAHLSI